MEPEGSLPYSQVPAICSLDKLQTKKQNVVMYHCML